MNSVDKKINLGNNTSFELLFKTHFKELHSYAYTLVKDWDLGGEIVQGTFIKLWERKDKELIEASARAYLYKMVYYESLNVIRAEKVKARYENYTLYKMKDESDDASSRLSVNEVHRHFQVAMEKLPEKCRAIFHLSRLEELKYQEIANKLGISIKTVETQMVKALKILRLELREFLPILIMIIYNLVNQ